MISGPVLLIHGAASDSRVWAPVIGSLPDYLETLTPDLSYYGSAPWPDEGQGFGVRCHADDIERFAKAAGQPVHLVCLSMSCHAGFVAMIRRPDLFRTGFFYEPGLTSHIDDRRTRSVLMAARRKFYAPVLNQLQREGPEAAVAMMMEGRLERMEPDRRAISIENARTLRLVMGQGQHARGNQSMPVSSAHLRAIKAPVCVAMGTATRSVYAIPSKAAAAAIPESDLLQVKGADHFLADDDPARFAAILTDWLDRRESEG